MQDSMNTKLMLCSLLKMMNMCGQKNELKFILWKILLNIENIESPETTRNGLPDHFMIPKKMTICYIISTDFIILYGCSSFDFWKTRNFKKNGFFYFWHPISYAVTHNKLCHTCNMANFLIFPLRWTLTKNFLPY